MAGCQEPGPLEDLRGSVKPYGRHVLVCTGRADWPAKIEDEKSFLGEMARDVKALGETVAPKPKITALATAPRDGDGEAVDLLVYPDGLAYRGVTPEAWARVRDEHLREGRVVRDLAPEALDGMDVLVCGHGLRDVRCGACGPLVMKALGNAIAARGLTDVRVHRTSHVGGHKYAGNVIVYPGGKWYGYVRPDDVAAFLDAHEEPTGTWESHLRGRGGELAP